MAAEAYARFGLQGVKATARRAAGDPKQPPPRYLVGIKLRGLYNRVRQLERVKAAFARFPAAMSWKLTACNDSGSVVCTAAHSLSPIAFSDGTHAAYYLQHTETLSWLQTGSLVLLYVQTFDQDLTSTHDYNGHS